MDRADLASYQRDEMYREFGLQQKALAKLLDSLEEENGKSS